MNVTQGYASPAFREDILFCLCYEAAFRRDSWFCHWC